MFQLFWACKFICGGGRRLYEIDEKNENGNIDFYDFSIYSSSCSRKRFINRFSNLPKRLHLECSR